MNDWEMAARIGLAALLGALIGLERSYVGKAAGVRTHALVSLGSGLAMILSIYLFDSFEGLVEVDPSRIAAQVVSGIGFLGAGAIIRSGASVKGLTTAATLWATAGVGLVTGAGYYKAALVSFFVIFAILSLLARLERKFLGKRTGSEEAEG